MPPFSTAYVSHRAPRTLANRAGQEPAPHCEFAIAHEFELVALAGRGTFADVWQVRDPSTGRLQALKQLRADRHDQPAARRILENEAEIGRKLSSEHVVKIIRSRLDADPPFVVLEWLSGQTLETRLAADERIFCREALWIARQCAQGMHDLLVSGYTHGDIKPSNVFLCDDGVAKLIDLGFARADWVPPADLGEASARTVTGTPEYMAPETLVSGNAGGAARDVYSLGVTLYQMLTGALPYQGDSVAEFLRQHQQSLAPRLRSLAPDVPREINDFVHRLLSKQPLRRGSGLSWLVRELIGLELSLLP